MRPAGILRPALALTAAALAATAILTACSGSATSPAQAPAKIATEPRPEPSYYLALGDSLSVGVQPDASGTSVETGDGYPDRV